MSWDPVELNVDVSNIFAVHLYITEFVIQPEETQPSLPAQLKTKIFEIGEVGNIS
jgi:hypothetical protein